jgi:hypothetical protein
MDDRQERQLESELGRLRPAAVPAALRQRIALQLEDESLTRADRVLVLFASLGSMAACLIVALGIWQWSSVAPRPGGSGESVARLRAVAEYRELLAAR